MDEFGALARSGAELQRQLRSLEPASYGRPSTCPGWSAADLANHVVGGERRYLLLLREAGNADVEATRGADHIADDPAAAYARYAAPLEEEFRRPGALARTVHHRAGDRSGRALLHMRVMERALHAWDLASTLGMDCTLDAGLVDFLLNDCLPLIADFRKAGFFGGQPAGGDPGEPPLPRLLRLTGRRPAARPRPSGSG